MSARASHNRGRLRQVRDGLRTAVLDGLWRQWSAVGASAAANRPARAVVDPEALVLASLCLIDDEPRLADVIAQWSLVNGGLLSVQRIKNLSAGFSGVSPHLAAFARLMDTESGEKRWEKLVRAGDAALRYRQGRSRTVRVPFERLPLLLLRLRVLLGVGVKADAVSLLLTHKRSIGYVNASEIARLVGYETVVVRRVLQGLAEAGWLHEVTSPALAYSADESSLGRLLGVAYDEMPPWGYTAGVFAMAIDVLTQTARFSESASEFAVDAALEELENTHRQALVDIELLPAHARGVPTDQSLDTLAELASWINSKI
jgi:hypothetical protein